mmetsp:Transcript_93404/g.246934  ORF Transcript_93404/g.246934 Transcript_93404/m.246934 type:complete len:223 (-) Transcript_93404:456-1124(-)
MLHQHDPREHVLGMDRLQQLRHVLVHLHEAEQPADAQDLGGHLPDSLDRRHVLCGCRAVDRNVQPVHCDYGAVDGEPAANIVAHHFWHTPLDEATAVVEAGDERHCDVRGPEAGSEPVGFYLESVVIPAEADSLVFEEGDQRDHYQVVPQDQHAEEVPGHAKLVVRMDRLELPHPAGQAPLGVPVPRTLLAHGVETTNFLLFVQLVNLLMVDHALQPQHCPG